LAQIVFNVISNTHFVHHNIIDIVDPVVHRQGYNIAGSYGQHNNHSKYDELIP
jgi:hypothetical protein